MGARFVQEVNAVTLAVERLHPEVNSVIELGGQDAKIILFQRAAGTGERRVISTMNDKCASGTGATIDKCVLKIGMSRDELGALHFDAEKLHHVAAKCGVFAETDIVNLTKAGVPAPEVMNSLADAIVMQNLSVLTRGNTLQAGVLLLGGPNTYLPFLQQCWRLRIPQTWSQRGYRPPPDDSVERLIAVPDNAQYYAAYGAVVFGMQEEGSRTRYRGAQSLEAFLTHGRAARLGESAGPALAAPADEQARFRTCYSVPVFEPAVLQTATSVRGFIGLDGGSTSSKGVLLDEDGELLFKAYRLSQGNPLQDAKDIFARIKRFVTEQGCHLEVLGLGTTGYAAEVLDRALRADANIVETVAHMQSATHFCGPDIDVICDVGGQDIKVLFLQHGDVKNFRLSNQCSAGNGMLLQAMADQFNVDVRDYADIAFAAELSPKFSYGCAVFLDSDRVNFQKEGFSREELFAGLAMVLPKNIWQYVVQIPRLGELGRKFVLQGGTQYNLAAVKAQVDYIMRRVPDAEVVVHPHCGEAGAIGAAIEARRVIAQDGPTRFIGLDAAIDLSYSTRTDAATRCTFCENHCSRTFIDTRTPEGEITRYIAGFSCEKGTVESKQEVVALTRQRRQLQDRFPNLVDEEASLVFRRVFTPAALPAAESTVADTRAARGWRDRIRGTVPRRPFARSSAEAQRRREDLRVGIPRALNVHMVAPFLRAYLETLGVDPRAIVFSDETSEELWLEGGRYNAIDPCFPAKVTLAHVHNLLHRKQARKPLNYLWFPCITRIETFVAETRGRSTCPIVAGTPKVVRAAFTKEKDFFAQAGVEYIDEALDFDDRELLSHQLYECWGDRLGVTRDESDWACGQGWAALEAVDAALQRRGREVLEQVEREHGVALVMLGRPYHNDPGLNHGVLAEFQSLGYPILSIRSLPRDPEYLARFFRDDLAAGRIDSVFDIRDVWPENYSTNSAQKVWAAKLVARHPHLAAIDLSSFKCGHDAPTYGIIDPIMVISRTPHLTLHDIDANRPAGSFGIRVKTFAYALDRFREQLHGSPLESSCPTPAAQRRTPADGAVPREREEVVPA